MSTEKTASKVVAADDVFTEFRKQPGYREAYDALDDEFAIMEALIKARAAADLSQTEVARRMKTTQSAIARLEGGAHKASLETLRKYAVATGHRLRIVLEPDGAQRKTAAR